MAQLTQLATNTAHPDLFVHHGAINVGILRDGRRALLIDFGDGDVQGSLQELGVERVDAVLFTHHHRDQASGVEPFAANGTRIGVPASEAEWFANVERYWHDPAHRWHLYDFRPHNLMLARSIPVHATYREGDTIQWGGATLSVLDTPGHTDGSVSYQVELHGPQGTERHLFCGDLLYDEGQIWELYSLQKGWGGIHDYHGFLGDRKRLVDSLLKLRAVDATTLIPSHGNMMADPAQAIDLLCQRLAACYERYAAISALRHYYPEMFAEFRSEPRAGSGAQARPGSGSESWRQGFMPIRKSKAVPPFLTHLGTSWIVSSADKAAFVLDCGSEAVIRRISRMQARGRLGPVEWLWITHYHDDHVDAIPHFQAAFGCPVVADESVAAVVESPLAWRLPCISPAAIAVDRRTQDGETWTWHEFTITAYHLPGQALYHGGLLVEGRGVRIFFAGDSFTMAGIDDYCAGNRNFLGQGVGFDACVRLIQALQPDYVLNSHVDEGFAFTDHECQFMRANLEERERLYGELFPWDHANYGMDEHWVRCHPYEQRVSRGDRVQLDVVLTNHSKGEREAACQPALPKEWHVQVDPQKAVLAPKSEGRMAFVFTVPRHARPGRWVVPVAVTYQGRRLGQFREAIVVVGG